MVISLALFSFFLGGGTPLIAEMLCLAQLPMPLFVYVVNVNVNELSSPLSCLRDCWRMYDSSGSSVVCPPVCLAAGQQTTDS